MISPKAVFLMLVLGATMSSQNGGDDPLPNQIIIDPQNSGRLAYNRDADGDGKPDPLFLCGPGGPEGFLFSDISGDGTPDTVLDKIIRYGGNTMYLIAVRSHGGDGKPDHNPFLKGDPEKGLDPKRLRGWERWFRRMEDGGINIFLFLYDDDVDLWKGEEIYPQERRYVEGMVNALEHHPNLVWVIAEEYSESLSKGKVRKLAKMIRATDDHDHLIGVHQLPGTDFDFPEDPDIELFLMQLDKGVNSFEEVHEACREAVRRASGRYPVIMAELPWHLELLVKGDRDGVRKVNWAAAMAGVSGVMHLGTWERAQNRKPPTQGMLEDYAHLYRFMESLPDLNEMRCRDGLVLKGKAWVLARRGHYVVYLPRGEPIRIDLSEAEGDLTAVWYDPRTGRERKAGKVKGGRVADFVPPDGRDWVLHIRPLPQAKGVRASCVPDTPQASTGNPHSLRLWRSSDLNRIRNGLLSPSCR